jgi:hypothetical protein
MPAHSPSLIGTRCSRLPRRHIYAVRYHQALHLCYVSLERNFLVLRPHSAEMPLQFLRIPLDASVEEYIVGRVCAVLSVYSG